MQRTSSFVIALLAWFAVITQLVIMLDNRSLPLAETLIRFISFFTILTNLLVALTFTGRFFQLRIAFRKGWLTALTSYILIVGIIYQLLLRHLWHPSGMQLVVDELLHTLIPLLVLIFWCLFEEKESLHYRQLPRWLIYPLIYFVYTLLRGLLSGYYPYPFIDINELGVAKALVTGVFILLFFVLVQLVLVLSARMLSKKIRRQ